MLQVLFYVGAPMIYGVYLITSFENIDRLPVSSPWYLCKDMHVLQLFFNITANLLFSPMIHLINSLN